MDLTTPSTSFPAASSGPASVLTNVRVCLWSKKMLVFSVHTDGTATQMNLILRHLPGYNFSCCGPVDVNSQWVSFFSHGWPYETIFKCKHCNRTSLLAHTQDLKYRYIEVRCVNESITFVFQHCEWFWMLTNLTVCGESNLFSLTRLQQLGSCHLTLYGLVLNCAPSRHVILFPDRSQVC